MTQSPVAWTPTVSDSIAVAVLDSVCYDRSLNQRQWSRLLSKPGVVALAVGPRESPAAVAVAESAAPGEFELLRLAVSPLRRRRGLGRWLVSVLGERHRLRLRLRETSTGALRFATAAGFRVAGIDRGGFGICDAVELTREATGGE